MSIKPVEPIEKRGQGSRVPRAPRVNSDGLWEWEGKVFLDGRWVPKPEATVEGTQPLDRADGSQAGGHPISQATGAALPWNGDSASVPPESALEPREEQDSTPPWRRALTWITQPRQKRSRPRRGERTRWDARRLQRLIFRGLAVVVAVLLLGLGLHDVLLQLGPRPKVTVIEKRTAGAGYPTQAAGVFAARFAIAYLTYDAADPAAHEKALQPYEESASQLSSSWNGRGKQTAVTALPSNVRVLDAQRSVVTVAALLSSGAWVYLAVPVRSESGAFLVGGSPAIVAPPRKASSSASSPQPPEDTTLTQSLQPTVTSFFKAWAQGDPTQLDYLTAPGAAMQPLEGEVRFQSLSDLTVYRGGATRTAIADVTWEASGGAQLTQSYRLTLVHVADRWLVEQVAATAWG